MTPGRARVLYDADCGFCRWALGWVLRWDRERVLEPIALQDPRAAALLSPLDAERMMASWHLVEADGSVTSAGAAGAKLMRLLPGGRPPAWLAERAPDIVDRAYRAIAGARGSLGPRLSRAAIARADRLIASRRIGAADEPAP